MRVDYFDITILDFFDRVEEDSFNITHNIILIYNERAGCFYIMKIDYFGIKRIDYFNMIAGHPDPTRLNNFDITKEDDFNTIIENYFGKIRLDYFI